MLAIAGAGWRGLGGGGMMRWGCATVELSTRPASPSTPPYETPPATHRAPQNQSEQQQQGKPIRRLTQVHISDQGVGGTREEVVGGGGICGAEIIAGCASKPLVGYAWGVEGGGRIDDGEKFGRGKIAWTYPSSLQRQFGRIQIVTRNLLCLDGQQSFLTSIEMPRRYCILWCACAAPRINAVA